jgi:hypothetical protein
MQVPLEDTFQEVIEGYLNKNEISTINKFEVINGSFPGWGTAQELLFFKHEGQKYKPDLVLLSFFINDVEDNYGFKYNEWASKVERLRLVKKTIKDIIKDLKLYSFMGDRIIPKYMHTFHDLMMKIGLMKDVRKLRELKKTSLNIPYLLSVCARQYTPQWQDAWATTHSLIEEMRKSVRQNGSELAIVVIPCREQIDEAWQKAWLSANPLLKSELDFEKPNRILTNICRKERIPCLDLLPYFRTYVQETGDDLYFPLDGHLNALGHHFCGKLIYTWLTKEKLVE